MKIFKFGGGILKDPASIKRIPAVLDHFNHRPMVIVISAFGKTTNALEEMIRAAVAQTDWETGFDRMRTYHDGFLHELFQDPSHPVHEDVQRLFTALHDELSNLSGKHFDSEYDLVVCYGELLSSRIVHHFLAENGIGNKWQDARGIIITDDTFREGKVDFSMSLKKLKELVYPELSSEQGLVVTQGFIGSTPDNRPTSLGREGSDYTAAILADLLDASEVTVWKDVPGIMNADPHHFDQTVKLNQISYEEATELAYYGAKVIHPKTTRPLQKKGIPMVVRSFSNLEDPGTIIQGSTSQDDEIPFYILKTNQVLISVTTRDLSFISEEVLHDVFGLLSRYRVKMNIMQNSALTLSLCVDERRLIPELIRDLQDGYSVKYNEGLELVTIRHYNREAINRIRNGREIILEQQNRTVIQFVMKQKAADI